MKKKALLSWSSGKDSAWTLYMLQRQSDVEVVGLFTTVNEAFNRVAMHAVRLDLLQEQAKSAGLPLHVINIPYPCSNMEYAKAMATFVADAKGWGVEYFAFGDLYLEDVRCYREDSLQGSGITPLFPLWGYPTEALSSEMVNSGLKAVITCVDPRRLSRDFVGREYNPSFLGELPPGVDPCGENGEFHSFACAGPMFGYPIEICVGEIVQREGFVFADLLMLDHNLAPSRAVSYQESY